MCMLASTNCALSPKNIVIEKAQAKLYWENWGHNPFRMPLICLHFALSRILPTDSRFLRTLVVSVEINSLSTWKGVKRNTITEKNTRNSMQERREAEA